MNQEEQTTMQREWMELQRQRFELDIARDRLWMEHITRQTRAMELQAEALIRLAFALEAMAAK